MRLFLSPRVTRAILIFSLVLAYAACTLPGFGWGLPSTARLRLYEASPHEVVGSTEERLFVTGPLQSYQVDECSTLIPLARMEPSRLQLNPHWFHWGTLYLYVTGAVLFFAKLLGLVVLTTDREYYLAHPEHLATVYTLARGVSWVFGLGAVLFVTLLVRRVARRPFVWWGTSFLFATAPLALSYARFGVPDAAVVFFTLLCAWWAGVGVDSPPSPTALVLSFAAAGAAASVKFHGGISVLLPVVQAVRWHRRLLLPGFLAAFVAFVLGTPYALLDWPRFKADVLWLWERIRAGHGLAFAGTKPGLLHHWTETLPAGTSPLSTVLMALSIALTLARPRARVLPVLVFLVVFWAQLGRSPEKYARYALPVLPLQLVCLASCLEGLAPRLLRTVGSLCLAGACLSQAVLASGHVKVFLSPDVRDRAAAWLAERGSPHDRIALQGRPYFATPPFSRARFVPVIVPLQTEAILEASPRWFILTDYDAEPVLRAPGLLPEAAKAVRFLLEEPTHRVTTFATAPRPPLFVSWSHRLLPHDLRYHCPTIWIVELSGR